MEITEINMISDFEAGMKCLQNPSLISGLNKIPQIYSFWKWGALFFAIYATFSSIIRRIKLILIRIHTVKTSSHRPEDIVEYTDNDEISSDDEDEEEHEKAEDRRLMTSFGGQRRSVDEDFCVKGVFGGQWCDGNLRKRRGGGGAWSEFAPGKSVVRLWDSLGLNLDFDEDLFGYGAQSVVSTWDAPARPVVLTAESNRKADGVILGGYDARMPRRVPALYAEWGSPAKKVAGVSAGGVGKVYVRDDVGGVLVVGDVRNVRRPLESDVETWWDADAVIADDDK
ncbi:hypothetical protein STAS_20725 [Striga asiatica]|uniref:Uncharacterized protein n=1 Tax=Striga asiatica TaxID=4170 RepID=A0A5A7QF26_STRAF|nr:hypothetical protein STAS_20725 [Striga asiatica]